MTDSIVRLDRLTRTYHKGEETVSALREVSLEIQRGEYVAIMGPSGSGKSTMLHLLGLLDQPTSGSYQLDGKEVAGLDDDARSQFRNRAIGFIFQSFNLFPQLDVVENVEVPMLYAGVPAAARRSRAEQLVESVGLTKRRSHRPSELSGGEMQRVAVARALVIEPLLLLADEPTGNLHSAQGEEIMKLFKALNEQGTTIIQVTHSDKNAEYGNRIVRLRDGWIEH
jgi:putative ABC transport system ATP-binding protein